VHHRTNCVLRSGDCLNSSETDFQTGRLSQLNVESSSTQARKIFDRRSCALHGMPHASRRARQPGQFSSAPRRASVDRSRASGSKLGTTSAVPGWFCCLYRQGRRGNSGEGAGGEWRDHSSADACLPFESSGRDGHHRLPKIRAYEHALTILFDELLAESKESYTDKTKRLQRVGPPFSEEGIVYRGGVLGASLSASSIPVGSSPVLEFLRTNKLGSQAQLRARQPVREPEFRM
jgi:hypothetical protein